MLRTITLAALNIVLPPPHNPQRYGSLWVDAFDHQTPMKLRGDQGGLIGSVTVKSDGEIWGDLYKFVNIDTFGKWLDLATGEAAPKEDVERKVTIPSSYRPNLRSVPYVFFPKQHRLIFASQVDQRNTLSPLMAKALIEKFLSRPDIVARHGQATVSIEPDRETLQRIFQLPRLKKIYMEVTPPNALGDVERDLIQFLEAQNATRYTQELSTSRSDGLTLNDETKLVAEVAQSNGYVEARGVNVEGRTVTLSTKSHPYSAPVTYDPKVTIVEDAFREGAESVVHEVARPIHRQR